MLYWELLYPGKRMNRKFWLVASHTDNCLQAADVIVNFCQRYQGLRLEEPPYWVTRPTP